MSSVLRRSGSKLSRILARAADPGAVASQAQLYAKTLSAVAQLFARSSGGIVHQLIGPNAVVPTNYVDGLGLTWASVSTVTVAAGIARSDDDTLNIILAAPITPSIAASGVNGLDTGAEAADAWYAIYVIADSTGVNAPATLISASFSAPTMPAGYDKKRRIGCVRNTASNFARFLQRWITAKTRRYYFDRDPLNALASGNATAFTSVSLAAFVPPSSRNVIISWFFTVSATGATADLLALRIGGGNSSDGTFQLRRGATLNAANIRQMMEMPCSDTQTIEYKVTQAQNAGNIRVTGFYDEI